MPDYAAYLPTPLWMDGEWCPIDQREDAEQDLTWPEDLAPSDWARPTNDCADVVAFYYGGVLKVGAISNIILRDGGQYLSDEHMLRALSVRWKNPEALLYYIDCEHRAYQVNEKHIVGRMGEVDAK